MIASRAPGDRQRRCGRSRRRWARCSCARRSRPTSRSAATARPRSSTQTGRMITQAEHIPVHLGAMPEAVAAVRERDPEPGEPWILNDPYAGGTHLPDLTIVTRTALGYAVTRAHHADVGGVEPGSLPADSHDARGGGRRDPSDAPRRASRSSGWSRQMRNPDERRGDLRAQLAAHTPRRAAGRGALRAPGARPRRRRRWTSSSPTRSASSAGRSASCPTAATRRADALETPDGLLEIRAAVTIAGDAIEIDFTGTARPAPREPQLPALGHPFRLLLRRALPDRARSPRIGRRVRSGHGACARTAASSTLGPRQPSPRATPRRRAGSWTWSSRRSAQAVPVPAQGQGTMNNVVLGNDRFTYYETIAGGQGACPDARRALRGPRGDVEHAKYARRSARARRTRSAWSATRCAADRAAPAASVAATGSSGSSGCSSRAACRS